MNAMGRILTCGMMIAEWPLLSNRKFAINQPQGISFLSI